MCKAIPLGERGRGVERGQGVESMWDMRKELEQSGIPMVEASRRKRKKITQSTYSQTGCFFAGNFANFHHNIGILIDNLLGAICNRREQLARFSCEFALCHLKTASLVSSANSFLN